MERNLERQTLSFSKGMTNVPSDLLSDDSELLESDGFIFKDGEMKAVQKGVSIGNVPYKIMYVHKMADYENIIAYDGTTNIYWYTKDDSGNIVSPPDGVTKSLFTTQAKGFTICFIKEINTRIWVKSCLV